MLAMRPVVTATGMVSTDAHTAQLASVLSELAVPGPELVQVRQALFG